MKDNKFELTMPKLKSLIKEEIDLQRISPSTKLTNQLLAEVNEQLKDLPEKIYFFISESKKQKERRMHRDDLQILNEKLSDLNAFINSIKG